MELLLYATNVLSHCGLLMIDIACLFILIRLACRWRSTRLLAAFDAAGRPLVELLTTECKVLCKRVNEHRAFTESHRLWLTLAALLLTKFLFEALANGMRLMLGLHTG